MFKFVLSAFVCLAFAMPVSAQCCEDTCGCDAPKMRIGFVPVQRSLPQISLKCVTDECGRSRRKLSIDRVCVTGAKLGRVERQPRQPLNLKGLFARKGCGCAAPAVDPCGCEVAPVESCGCEAAPEPVEESCGCEAAPEPVAACGCNG